VYFAAPAVDVAVQLPSVVGELSLKFAAVVSVTVKVEPDAASAVSDWAAQPAVVSPVSSPSVPDAVSLAVTAAKPPAGYESKKASEFHGVGIRSTCYITNRGTHVHSDCCSSNCRRSRSNLSK